MIAGNLTLESKQNTSNSDATSFSLGGGVGNSGGGKSGNLNLSLLKANSDKEWVDKWRKRSEQFATRSSKKQKDCEYNQASIIGSNSVAINVGKNTDIVGAVIANIRPNSPLEGVSLLSSTTGMNNSPLDGVSLLSSTTGMNNSPLEGESKQSLIASVGGQNGIDGGNLNLNTASLTYSDLKNYNNSESNQFAVSLQLNNNPNNPETLRRFSRFASKSDSHQSTSVASLLCLFSLKTCVKHVFLRSNPGNLTLSLNQQGREQSSDSKATIGGGRIIISGQVVDDGNSNNPSPNQLASQVSSTPPPRGSSTLSSSQGGSLSLAGLNRDITKVETNKRDILTSDFDAKLTIDTRLIAAVRNMAVGNTEAAKANVGDYWNQTKKGVEVLEKASKR